MSNPTSPFSSTSSTSSTHSTTISTPRTISIAPTTTTQEGRVLHQGYGTKQGGAIKSWKRRWFVLMSTGNLSYYTSEDLKIKKGELNMRECSKVIEIPNKKFCIELYFSTRTLKIVYEENEDGKLWLNILKDFVEDNFNYKKGFSKYDLITIDHFEIDKDVCVNERGSIHECTLKKNGKKYAIKKLVKEELKPLEITRITEIHNMLKTMPAQNTLETVLKLENNSHLIFVMAPFPQRQLKEVIHSELSMDQIKQYAVGLLLAIDSIHYLNYIHREINPETIYLTEDNKIMLSTPLGVNYHYECGVKYCAPEVFQDIQPTGAIDYWSLGVLLYDMIFGKVPFDGEDDDAVFEKVTSQHVEFPENSESDIVNMIEAFLTKDPVRRTCIFEKVIAMPFFKSMNIDMRKRRMQSVMKKKNTIL